MIKSLVFCLAVIAGCAATDGCPCGGTYPIKEACRDHRCNKVNIAVVSSSHCVPCQQFEPVVRQLQSEGWPIYLFKDRPDMEVALGITAYPTTVVIDEHGQIVARHVGYIDIETARQYLTKYKDRIK